MQSTRKKNTFVDIGRATPEAKRPRVGAHLTPQKSHAPVGPGDDLRDMILSNFQMSYATRVDLLGTLRRQWAASNNARRSRTINSTWTSRRLRAKRPAIGFVNRGRRKAHKQARYGFGHSSSARCIIGPASSSQDSIGPSGAKLFVRLFAGNHLGDST